jgi:hypothetical protein
MKKINLHIILILVLIAFVNGLYSQCDFFGSVSVESAGYTIVSGYTQQYILVEDNSGTQGNIVAINSDGNFGVVDVGSYYIYAVNYEGAQPAELAVGQSWTNLNTYDQDNGNCFEMSGAYLDRAINVCSPDDICLGNPIEIAVQGYAASSGYELRYILVNQTTGTIVDFNSDGSFGFADYGSAGTYEAYALSTNDLVLISNLTIGMLYTDFSDLADATCAGILGPRTVTVLDNNFTYVSDGTNAEATAFCEVDGWTHYSTAANPHDFIFSIYKNSNDFTATVEISVAAAEDDFLSTASNAEYSTHTLRRSWSVEATGGDYNDATGTLTNAVRIRFYYPAAEKALLDDITDDFLNGTNTSGINTNSYNHNYIREARWFKSNDGDMLNLASMTTAELITNAYSLTVIGDDLTTANGVNYVELADITGFSGGTYAVGTGPNSNEDVLPVEFTLFEVYAENDNDVLIWETASEVNNDFFVVEKSENLYNYFEIAKVQGQGTTNVTTNYQYFNQLVKPGITYYRLKQVDFDGGFKYSQIVPVIRDSYHPSVNVYPNPFSDVIRIEFCSEDNIESTELRLYDDLGRMVYSVSGKSLYGSSFIELNLANLRDGIYHLKIIQNKNTQVVKIVKKT